MSKMLRPARLLTAAGFALLCLVLTLGYASAQTVPAAPTIDSLTSGDTTLTVAWTAPAGEAGITAYDVRHIETSGDETDDDNWTVADNAWTSETLEYTIIGLTNGTEYDVQVRAINANGDGTWSDTKTGTPALPAPTLDSVRADDRAVLVSWSAPTGITTRVAAYDVRHILTSEDEAVDSNWTVEEVAWEEGGGSLAYAITGLTNGTEYDVQVRAVDEDDVDGAWSATTSATPADHGNTRTAATSVTAGTRVWGVIDPTDDEDYFSFRVSRTGDYWIYTLGDLDTVGELLDIGGMSIGTSDRGGALPNPDNFFMWGKLESGTYYIKITGFGPTDEPYILRVREFTDTTSRGNAATLDLNGSASGTIDPEDDDDYFKLELSETTEVAIRASGFPDTVGELQMSNGTVIASNDDGYLPGGRTNFLIRESLAAGVYYVKVSSFGGSSDGPYSVYAAAITEPGSSTADAQALTLGVAAGGFIDPADDEDYFSLTLEETTYVIVGGVSEGINISGALTNELGQAAPVDSVHFYGFFQFLGTLDAGKYHLKVTGDGIGTGRYTVRAIVGAGQTVFVNRCSNISRSAGINDPLYGCQWHLNNDDQFRNSAGQDIRVEEVWPTRTGSGINVAVVDDGMHYTHEDLTVNVDPSFNHNYDPDIIDTTDIYHPFEDHGTAVAGLIAAKDNGLGMRGVAPEATIYGYNYLVEQSDANEADAMSRNAATTAISNNSWGPGDSGRPEHATGLWETAVKNGVTTGYGGKGVFYAWAAGNGGDLDYSTLDEYSNFHAVTAVCAVGHDDVRSDYSESGANLWVCGPSSSGREGQPRIATTDNGHRYRGSFGGTSAATPIVSGVVALVREANNELTWRDIKLILAASARKVDPDNTGWVDGAFKYGSSTDRYNFNHEYGFGMVDAKAAVDLAPGWTNVGDLREITSEAGVINLPIPDLPSSGTPTTVSTSLSVDPYVEFVEFVEVNAHFDHPYFRNLTVELVSPSGAVSTLSPSVGRSGALTTTFRFGSARHLGEDAAGEWTLRVKDAQRGYSGMLKSWGLTIYGHGFVPGAPGIDTVTLGQGTATIDWKAPTDPGETPITSYDLRYISDEATDRSDDQWTVVTGVGTLSDRSHTITGLENAVKYEIQLRALNDSGHGPWSAAETITAELNEPPVVTGNDDLEFQENRTGSITRYTASDPERDPFEWSLTGADESFFSIDDHGYLTFNEPPDFEANRGNVYDLTVVATDTKGNAGELEVKVTVTDVNEPPTVNGRASFSVVENDQSISEPYFATDPEGATTTFTWSLGGTDRGDFEISSTGALTFNNVPDYDRPADSGGNNEYDVQIRVYDGSLTGTLDVTVTVTNVNEPPVVTAVGGSENTTFPENSTSTVGRFRATDPERGSFVWSVDPARDGSFFSMNDDGYLDFKDPPDFEASRGSTYELTVVATDTEGNAGELDVRVTVTDVNEPPTVTGDTVLSVDENTEDFSRTYSASDPEGADSTFTWSLSGTDSGDFNINRDTGELTFRNIPNYESPADYNRNNEYLVTVVATDQGNLGGNLPVTVTVNDVNEPPSITGVESRSLPENSVSEVATYRADDPERATITWSVSGADDDDFAISATGVLTFANIPDFEAPTDANQDNEYLVTVEARDDDINRATLDVTVTVTNSTGAEEPTITTTSNPSPYRENGTGAVYTFRARDPQGRAVSWRVMGTDGQAFGISSSGALTFRSPPDFENPTDADGDNVYEITVVVTDDQSLTDSVDVTVTVTNDAEGVEPTISTRRPPNTYRENGTSAVYTFRASDPQRQVITWTLEGTDRGEFTITRDSSSRGVLAFNSPPDFEAPADSDGQNDYELTVIATDENGNADRLSFTITVTDVNEGPEITRIGNAPGSVPETYDSTLVLARYTATDPEDPGAVITRWSTSGTDGGDFVMSEQGELRFRNQPDHERPADSNRDNVYVFTVRASDGRYYGEFSETVTVDNVNEPPMITTTSRSATALSQPENRTTRLYTYRATDPEGEAIAWSVGGVDYRSFAINQRGELSFDETQPPDYEQPGDSGRDNVYNATVRAQDSGGIPAELEITVTVTPVNEGPEVTGGRSSFTIDENRDLPGGVYSGFDPEGGTVTRWSLGGQDGGDFTISNGGVLTFRNLPDYERPADSNRDNVYELEVRPYDGRYYGSFDVMVTVSDVNEPPTITTTSSSATTMTHPENRASRLYTYRATDPEGATIAWSVAGVDDRFFTIDPQGQFYFSTINPPDFEARAASGQDHVYNVTVRAGDGTHTTSLPVAVTVTDVNEAPEVTSGQASFTIRENLNLPNAAYSAIDPEGFYVTRWSVGGRDGGDFLITQGGTLYFRSLPDFERPADSNRDNVYEVIIQPYDGRNTGSYAVTVTVTDVNEPPEFRSGSQTSFTQPENRTSRLYAYSATDPEGGTVTWSVGGTDESHFTIDEGGEFSFREDSPPDFDAPGDVAGDNLYNVTIEARDPESHTTSLSVTVRVTEVNEGPVITRQGNLSGNPPGSVAENHAATQALATYTASDPERPSVRVTQWSTTGADGGDFVMNALGELRFTNSPDYERPADSNRDNVYGVTIRASDGRNTGILEEVQVVTVTDVNEAPTITTTSRTAFSQPENRNPVLYTFRATDPEGSAVAWTAVGTDGSHFTMDERGALFFSDPPDFDNPGDAGRNNVYNVTVQARDESFNPANLDVVVTVTDDNESVEPTISARRPPATYRENGTSTVYTFRASDPQRGVIAWSLQGDDRGDFSISESGQLTFTIAPDFENPADADLDNVYELTVVATDDEGHTDSVSFTIAVTNDAEGVEPTISTRRPPATYRENGTSPVYTFRASDPQRDPISWSMDGTDAGDFSITADSSGRGALAFLNPPDFENPVDSDRDNTYELAVVATDGGGNADRVDFAITVTDVNEGPQITLDGTATTSVPENYADTVVLARYTASDPESPGTGIYQWSATGRDGGDFVISALGELRFRSSPDFERPADADRDNVYEVTVRAYDGRVYGTLEEPLMVTVTEVNEAPVITTKSRTEFTLRENSTSVVHTYRATDEDEDDIVRWSVEGTDGEDFAIYNGMLTFRRLPDLELPADADRDNVYEITVVAADNGGLRDTVNATIAITDQAEGPVIAGTGSFTVTENYDITQALGSYTATDARDGRRVYPQWSLSGRDGGDFVIDRYSGALAFRNTPDYDRPADSDRDNVYEVTVRGHDSRAYGYLNVTVAVTNINEGAPVVTGRTSHTVRENTTSAIHTYRATDPDLGDTIAWSTGGTDAGDFVITRDSSGGGLLGFASPPDFENPADSNQDNVYNLEVMATDGEGLRGSLAVTVTVTALNEGPVVSGTAAFTINENQDLDDNQAGFGTTYVAVDPEAIGGVTTTITWSVSGRDGGDFTIDRETGALTFRTLPNYERPADSNRDNVYEVIVRAYDGRNYGAFDVTVTVLAVNEGPVITGRDTFTYRENGTAALHTYRATDPEGDDFTWQLGGPDASDFAITTDSSGRGVLTFASPPNFDSPADSNRDNEYLVTVQARDDQGNTGELLVTVTVTDQNEGPVVSGQQVIAVQENRDPTLVLATYTAIDPEGLPITRWSLSGSDGGDFLINESGDLTFRATPDYDRPADSNRDNEYLITVRAYDGRTYGSLDVTITVSNENEAAPVVTGRDAITVRENTTSTLYTYRATDADRNTMFMWSVEGTDGNEFAIDGRGALTFSGPPNYELPTDLGGNNEYAITIVARDGEGREGTLEVTVTVTGVDEGPEITGTTTYTVAEGQELAGANFTARDPEDPTIVATNWRTSGNDGGDFTISQDGTLSFRSTPDYERPADSNRDNEYLVTVQVSDGRYYGSLEVTVTVTDRNESNPSVAGRDTLSVRENTTATLHTYRATDMDRGAEIRWSVRGTDNDDFTISNSGELSFSSNPDHEQPTDSNGDNVYEITIVASDGTNEGTLDVTITVTEVNEGPEITGRDTITVAENDEAILARYTGTDPEDTTAEISRWSVAGRDGGDFTINSDGELTFRYPPNYERPADADRDNVYEASVRAYDGRVYGTYEVVVTVEAVDEAPEFRSGSRVEFTYRENGTSSLYTYRATDPEGAEVSWSVSGTDGEDFEISDSGLLSFKEPPDYDDAGDFDQDNEYEVLVVATDQTGHAADLAVTVTVTDVNEGPEIISCTETEFDTVLVIEFEDCDEITVVENHDEPLYTYTARDPEIPDLEITRWSLSGRDGGDFTITEDGELSFRNPPDHERPADANRDSIYEVTVRASDGRYYGTFDVTVTVEAVDEAPEFHSNSQDSFSYQENQTSALHTYRATDPEGGSITWGLSGTDAAAFVISETGVLTFLNVPDYEDPADSDDDNVYEVTVEAADENGNTAPWEVTVTVVNLTD